MMHKEDWEQRFAADPELFEIYMMIQTRPEMRELAKAVCSLPDEKAGPAIDAAVKFLEGGETMPQQE